MSLRNNKYFRYNKYLPISNYIYNLTLQANYFIEDKTPRLITKKNNANISLNFLVKSNKDCMTWD